jgi:PAS domain S-box-containing protein
MATLAAKTPVQTISSLTQRLSLRQKIHIGFGGIILLMLVSMGITLFKLADVEQIADSAIAQRQPAAALFQRLDQDLNLATTLLNGYLLTGREDLKEEYAIVEQDLVGNFANIKDLALFKQGEISAQDMQRAEHLMTNFKDYAMWLFKLRDDDRQNYPGMTLAQETIQPHAVTFLSTLNLLLNSEDLALSNPEMLEARDTLNELRYIWVQMMSSLRLFLTDRSETHLENFENFSTHAAVLLIKLDFMDQEIGFGELEDMATARVNFLDSIPPVLEIYRSDSWRADAHMMKTEVQPLVEELRGIFESIADYQLNAATEGGTELTDALSQIRVSTIVILIVGLLLGSLLASRIINSILPPIRSLMHAAEQIAQGDLNAEVMVTTGDEVGQMGNSFNAMVNDLRAAALKEQQYFDELKTLNHELEDRVQARTEELARSETKIRAVLDNIGEGILVIDNDGKVESLNPAAETIFGLGSETAIGMNSALLLSGNEIDNIAELNEFDDKNDGLFHSEGDHQPREYVGQRADGSTFPMEFVVTSMSLGDEHMRVCIVRDITSRKETEATLAEAQQSLVDAAHKSGMADMATGVLHNIGNILNSVNLAGEEIHRIASGSKVNGLLKANELLSQHQDNLGEFLINDAKGQKLPGYYLKMGPVLEGEVAEIKAEAKSLLEKTTMMKEVISTQQAYAKSGFHNEELNLPELVEDALKIQDASLHKWGVKLHKQFNDTPICVGQKSKLLQVVTNLIKNAKEAMSGNDDFNKPKELSIETGVFNEHFAFIRVKDNGCGISEEQLAKIFNHGFTTKKQGHGFGLHTSANAMTEMKGSLKVDSDGVQQGASFTLSVPIRKAA